MIAPVAGVKESFAKDAAVWYENAVVFYQSRGQRPKLHAERHVRKGEGPVCPTREPFEREAKEAAQGG
jgi:hypothetical protein